jgi:hypothetical protein
MMQDQPKMGFVDLVRSHIRNIVFALDYMFK